MNSAETVKTKWTWDEWRAGRQARRDLSRRVGAPIATAPDRRTPSRALPK